MFNILIEINLNEFKIKNIIFYEIKNKLRRETKYDITEIEYIQKIRTTFRYIIGSFLIIRCKHTLILIICQSS